MQSPNGSKWKPVETNGDEMTPGLAASLFWLEAWNCCHAVRACLLLIPRLWLVAAAQLCPAANRKSLLLLASGAAIVGRAGALDLPSDWCLL